VVVVVEQVDLELDLKETLVVMVVLVAHHQSLELPCSTVAVEAVDQMHPLE
jgi:hypothetical protein